MLNGDGFNIFGDCWFLVWSFMSLYAVGFYKMLSQCIERHRVPTGIPGHDLLKRKVAIVTGGAEGIGLSISDQLIKLGLHTIIACNDVERGEEEAQQFRKKYKDGKVDVIKLDLSSFDSIKSCAKSFHDMKLPLHILINNAGVMVTPYTETEQRFESQLGINLIGHFLFTRLLLPLLVESGADGSYSRVVNTASVVNCVGDVTNIFRERPYSAHAAYADSKSAIIMTSYWLDSLLREQRLPVTVNTLHPGVVGSGIFRHVSAILRKPQELLVPVFFKTYEQAADTTVYVALSEELEGRGGLYVDNCSPAASSRQTYNSKLQRKLWLGCCKWTGQSERL